MDMAAYISARIWGRVKFKHCICATNQSAVICPFCHGQCTLTRRPTEAKHTCHCSGVVSPVHVCSEHYLYSCYGLVYRFALCVGVIRTDVLYTV